MVNMVSRRDSRYSRAVIGVSATLTGLFAIDAAFDLGLAPRFALVPTELLDGLATLRSSPLDVRGWLALLTLFSSVCVHADLTHLGFNLLYFWFFGSLLAKVAGDRWVVMGLLLCSITSGAAFVLSHLDGPASAGVIGASGAISGVAGFYVLLAFRWEIPDAYAWPLARPVPTMQAAAIAILATALDVWVLNAQGGDGIARDAHVGGFAGGLFLGMVLTSRFETWIDFQRSRWAPATSGRRSGGDAR